MKTNQFSKEATILWNRINAHSIRCLCKKCLAWIEKYEPMPDVVLKAKVNPMTMKTPSSDFWKTEELETAKTGTIITEPELVTTNFGERYQITLRIGKTDKKLTMNATTTKELMGKFGKNEKDWIDKKVSIEISETRIRGEKKKAVYLS
jgi:hypothetical protein